jgi:hypothetical protein
MLPTKFRFIWPKIGQSETRIDLYKSSPLKPLGQMNRNLVGSFHGRSSIKNAHFVPIGLQTWPSQEILVSDWLSSKISSPLKPLGQVNRNLVGSILVSVHLAKGLQRRRLNVKS